MVLLGVYGFSYDYQSDMRTPEYLFALTATTVPRVSRLGEPCVSIRQHT
jgi:hypothetical protein